MMLCGHCSQYFNSGFLFLENFFTVFNYSLFVLTESEECPVSKADYQQDKCTKESWKPKGHFTVWGLVCRSLAGLGRTLSKTRSQMEKRSSSPFPIAGRTGAKTEHMELGSEENTSRGVQSTSGPYSVKFIQHADHQSTPV